MTDVCGATLRIGDDFGDNECTFRCQLAKGHEGNHQEIFQHGGEVVITFNCNDGENDGDGE